MIDEPSSDGALGFVDTVVESFSVLDERSEFSVCFRRHVNGFEFVHGSHASEFQGVVFVRFAFDVGPSPCIFVGRADEGFESEADREIIDPSGGSAGFHDNEIDFVFLEDSGEVIPIGCGVEKRVFSSFGVEKAAHGIELA